MELSAKLVELRKEKGWTQAVAAKNIDIQQSYLSKLESGLYQPSTEVIEKICRAYGVKQNKILPRPKADFTKYSTTPICLCLGLFLFLAGYFSLFFPDTFYTYQVKQLATQDSKITSVSYHLTDNYLGETFIDTVDGKQFEYQLSAQRVIKRAENRWMIVFGLMIMSVPVIVFLYRQHLQNAKKPLK